MTDHDQLVSMKSFGERLAALADRDEATSQRSRIRRRRAIAAVGITVAALVALTPAGHAVAERLGDLVGIGDEPSEVHGRTAVVIGTGKEKEYPYEIVASSAGFNRIERPGDPPVVCISVEFPGVSGVQAANCLTGAAKAALPERLIDPIAYGAPSSLYPDAELIIQGLAVPEVESMELAYTSVDGTQSEAPVSVSYLGGALSEQIGVDEETRFFVAFIPADVLEAPARADGPLTIENATQALADIQITANDASGHVLATKDLINGVTRAAERLVFVPPAARFADHASFGDEPQTGEHLAVPAPPPAEVDPSGTAIAPDGP